MTYEREGDRIRIGMQAGEYESLLVVLGFVLGSIDRQKEPETFWATVEFINALNGGNPQFTPYEIPEEFRGTSAKLIEMMWKLQRKSHA